MACLLLLNAQAAAAATICSINLTFTNTGASSYRYDFSSTDYAACDPGGVGGVYTDAGQGTGQQPTTHGTLETDLTVFQLDTVIYRPNPLGYIGSDSGTLYDINGNTIAVSITMAGQAPIANNASATVAHGSSSNNIALNITGGTATSVAVGTQATHGTATASGTSITYTPTASYSGSDSFTYTASNAAGTSAPATVAVTVSNVTVSYAPSSPAAGTVGTAYSQSLASASGATAPYTYALASGSLPAGVTLASNGTLSGTPTAGGAFNFTVTATDSSTGTGPFSTTSGALTLNIAAPTISVSPVSLTAATVASAYSQTVTASGGTSSYTYAVIAGALPAGLSLSSGGGLSGTPTAGGSFNFTVMATDSSTGTGAPYTGSRAYTLTVNAPTIVVAPTTLSAVAAGATVSGTITASGGVSGYTYVVTAGSLPPGVSLSSAGALSGAATSVGTYNFTMTATDSSTGTGPFTGSRAYTWTVNAPTLSISPVSGSNLSGSALSAYSQSFTPSGGNSPYTYGIVINSGAMPAGLSFSNSTGNLSGTPTAGGVVGFTVTAVDATTGSGAPFSVSGTYNLTIGVPTVVVAPVGSVSNPVVGTSYSQTFTASGATAPYGYSISAGSLPAGLTLSAAGVLSGTPTAAGTFNFTVQATDANNFAGTRAYSITIAAPTIAVAPATLPNGNLNVAYSQTVSGSGGTAPYSFAVTAGTLPTGLTLNSATGAISGTPTTVNTYNFTVSATDSTMGTGAPFSASRAYTVVIGIQPPLAGAKTVSTPYNTAAQIDLALVITGGAPASIAVAGVPAHGSAVVSGLQVTYTPTAGYVGTDSFTYTATNSGGTSAPATVTVTVAALQTATGAGLTLAITNPGATCTLVSSAFTALPQLPSPPPSGYTYPYAAVDFTARQCTVNSDLTVTLTFPNPVPANAVLMKYDAAATPPWQSFTPTSISGNQVTYKISDGGALDADKVVNGEFMDPAILAMPLAAQGIPALDRWALVLLALVLGAAGWRVSARRWPATGR